MLRKLQVLVEVTLPFVAAPGRINKDISTFVPRAAIAVFSRSPARDDRPRREIRRFSEYFCNIAGNNCSVQLRPARLPRLAKARRQLSLDFSVILTERPSCVIWRPLTDFAVTAFGEISA